MRLDCRVWCKPRVVLTDTAWDDDVARQIQERRWGGAASAQTRALQRNLRLRFRQRAPAQGEGTPANLRVAVVCCGSRASFNSGCLSFCFVCSVFPGPCQEEQPRARCVVLVMLLLRVPTSTVNHNLPNKEHHVVALLIRIFSRLVSMQLCLVWDM